MMPERVRICNRCLLPETFPGIRFDDQGGCNHYQRDRGKKVAAEQRKKYEEKFLELLGSDRSQGNHDVIVAYSGGKDSTYILDLFVNRYGLCPLALITFNNTFISPRAMLNIATVCDTLGVNSMIVRPDSNMLRAIFTAAAEREMFSAKTLERASTICTCCISFVKGIVLRTALEKQIPFIGYGWSPGQAPTAASVMKINTAMMQNAQNAPLSRLLELAGERILPFFVTPEQFAAGLEFPWHIHPLTFLEYDEELVVTRIEELGWQRPDDTDPNSSNCLLNAFANHVHCRRYRFHPYVWEIANMVRPGVIEREEGVEKIHGSEQPGQMRYAARLLGFKGNAS